MQECAGICRNVQECAKMRKICRNVQKMCKNVQECAGMCNKCARMCKNVQKMCRNVQKMCPKDESEDEEQSSSDLEDNACYQDWLEEAKETIQDTWNVKYQKYINEGMTEDQAGEKANAKTLWAVKRNFFARFKYFLLNYLRLKDDDTYQEITRT